MRNAAIVLGNQRQSDAVAVLQHGLHDAEPIVRAACVWALRQIATDEALAIVAAHCKRETDAAVLDEMAAGGEPASPV